MLTNPWGGAEIGEARWAWSLGHVSSSSLSIHSCARSLSISSLLLWLTGYDWLASHLTHSSYLSPSPPTGPEQEREVDCFISTIRTKLSLLSFFSTLFPEADWEGKIWENLYLSIYTRAKCFVCWIYQSTHSSLFSFRLWLLLLVSLSVSPEDVCSSYG